jgi:hypothetical protein
MSLLDRGRAVIPQSPILRKYLLSIVLIACFGVLANGAHEWWSFNHVHRQNLDAAHKEAVQVAADRIVNYIAGIQSQAQWTLLPLLGDDEQLEGVGGLDWLEQSRLAALRLFRESPAVRNVYRLSASGTLDRAALPPGLEDWAGEPFLLATGDPHRAQALWSFAHGMVILEIDGRFPDGSDLDRTWRAGAAVFAPR